MNKDKIRELEEQIADLKARWPRHSVPPSMWMQLDELEEALELEKSHYSLPRKGRTDEEDGGGS
jgi:hypothetical protein